MPRRAFLAGAGVVGGSSAVAVVTGQWFADRARIATDVVLPKASRTLRALPAGFDVPGLSPWVTPASDFYRVDVNLLVPGVDVGTWRLDIDGLVERPFSLQPGTSDGAAGDRAHDHELRPQRGRTARPAAPAVGVRDPRSAGACSASGPEADQVLSRPGG